MDLHLQTGLPASGHSHLGEPAVRHKGVQGRDLCHLLSVSVRLGKNEVMLLQWLFIPVNYSAVCYVEA